MHHNGDDRRHDDGHFEVVPRIVEVLFALFPEPQRFVYDEVDDYAGEYQLRDDQDSSDRAQPAVDMERRHTGVGHHAPCSRELHQEVDEREQVDVRIVDGVLEEDGARIQVDPVVFQEVIDQLGSLSLRRA